MDKADLNDSGFDFDSSTPEGAALAHQVFGRAAPMADFEDSQFSSQDTLKCHQMAHADIEVGSDGDLTPPTPINSAYPFNTPGMTVPEYKREANQADEECKASLLIGQESMDTEMDEITLTHQTSPANRPSNFNQIGGQGDWKELRKQYETTAVSRPRSSTPVSMCQLEEYIDNMEKRISDSQYSNVQPALPLDEDRMKISLPEESLPPVTRHRRTGSMSWNDFYDKMVSEMPPQISGVRSGAATPTKQLEQDLLEHNPAYSGKLPPAPVVHRRTSMEWVVFDENIHPIDPSVSPSFMDQPAEPHKLDLGKERGTADFQPIGTEKHTDATCYTEPKRPEDLPEAIEIPCTPYAETESKIDNECDSSRPDFLHSPEVVPRPSTNSIEYEPTIYDNAYKLEPTESYKPSMSYDQQLCSPTDYTDTQGGTTDPYNTDSIPHGNGWDSQEEYQENTTNRLGTSSTMLYDDQQIRVGETNAAPTAVYNDPYNANIGTYDQEHLPSPLEESATIGGSYPYDDRLPSPPPTQYYSITDNLPNPPFNQYYSETSWSSEQETSQLPAEPTPYSSNYSSTYLPPPPPPPIITRAYDDWGDAEQDIAPDYVPPGQPPEQILPETKKQADDQESDSKTDADTEMKQGEADDEAGDWKTEYEKLTQRLTQSVQLTQEKMKEIGEKTAVKDYEQRHYEIRSPTPPPPDNLMNLDSEAVKPSDSKEWKPISQVLNDEIKKQKELTKPKRPPPPKGVPSRPPPPRRPPLPTSAWDENNANTQQYIPVDNTKPSNNNEDAMNELNDFMQEPPPPPSFTVPNGQIESLMEPDEVQHAHWAPLDSSYNLAPSDSGFFSRLANSNSQTETLGSWGKPPLDPFAPVQEETLIMLQSYDPFQTKTADEMMAEAKAKADLELGADEAQKDMQFFGGLSPHTAKENGGAESPVTSLGDDLSRSGFEDDFGAGEDDDERPPSPLYDEDDSAPLEEFPPKCKEDGWNLMLRYPLKKKLMGKDRFWKPVFVRVHQGCILLYYDKNDPKPFHELPLQANYCLSDVVLQQYDIYGKIHTVKLQFVVYKERVGLRPGQIPKLVEGHFSKLGLPLEHAAQSTPLLKFGSLESQDILTFVNAIEDVFFVCPARREGSVMYKQDEIQVHCYDEYKAHVDKDGHTSNQLARVRLFCLAFVSGMPAIEIGLNDRRRQGKEIVRRKDILPMYTERWIRFEALEFNSLISTPTFDKEQVIRFMPPDGTFFEIMRFRVRPPPNKELPLHVKAVMKIAGSRIEIRLECMVASFRSRKAHQVPCEDIQIRFPIPEAWIYLFREERHWGYGSVHSKGKRPGKVKNLKDRLMGVVQAAETSLIEAAIGDAKYEHVYRALVWRIPRLPEKHHAAYKNHLLTCKFELSSFDLMPEQFMPNLEVEFTMPMATVSHTVVRSISLDAHEDPDRVEKYVRCVAKHSYDVEIDYVQTTELDMDAVLDPTNLNPEITLEKSPEVHKTEIDASVAKDAHEGYRIDFTDAEMGGNKFENDSSSDEEGKGKKLLVQIDMSGYGY